MKRKASILEQLADVVGDEAIQDALRSIAYENAQRSYSVGRGDEIPEWMNEVLYALNDSDHSMELSASHSIEAKVKELRERVKLDYIQKTASEIPLYKKSNTTREITSEDVAAIRNFIQDFLRSHRGHADFPALWFELKDRFDNSILKDLKQDIEEFFGKEKQNYDSHIALPNVDMGQPRSVNTQDDSDDNVLFKNIINSLTR